MAGGLGAHWSGEIFFQFFGRKWTVLSIFIGKNYTCGQQLGPMGAWVENAGVEINDLLASATVYQRHLTKKLNMLQDKQFLRYHLFQNWSNVLSLGALSITAIRTACCRPGSRRIVVTILLRQLSSSCTTISSAQSTVASSFLSTCST